MLGCVPLIHFNQYTGRTLLKNYNDNNFREFMNNLLNNYELLFIRITTGISKILNIIIIIRIHRKFMDK